MDRKIVYICDPNKNASCEKTGCGYYGGVCFKTTDPDSALRLGSILITEGMLATLLSYEIENDLTSHKIQQIAETKRLKKNYNDALKAIKEYGKK